MCAATPGPSSPTWPAYPRDALLLSIAVPTIAFAGVTEVPEEAWSIVERAAPAYGDDWWFTGLLGFVRQEQRRFDEAMALSCRSLDEEPSAGHSAHARAHAHYETGDHAAGLAWMGDWLTGDGAATQSLTHFAWHAALHELSLGDLDAVRRRYDAQLLPEAGLGCRALVDSGSLLFRWAITPGAADVPDLRAVTAVTDRELLERPATPFVAMHAAVTMLALGDRDGLVNLTRWAAGHAHPVHREVVAPLGTALLQMEAGRYSEAADALARLDSLSPRLGGSDAQREILEETRICALLRADRYDDARRVLDARLDRRRSPRDERWRAECRPAGRRSIQARRIARPLTRIFTGSRPVVAGPVVTSPVAASYWLPWKRQVMVLSATLPTVWPWCLQIGGEGLELPLARLGDHDPDVGEDDAAADGDLVGRGQTRRRPWRPWSPSTACRARTCRASTCWASTGSGSRRWEKARRLVAGSPRRRTLPGRPRRRAPRAPGRRCAARRAARSSPARRWRPGTPGGCRRR